MRSAALALAAVVAAAGCSGKDGANGANGENAPIPAGGGLKLELLSATAPAAGQPTARLKVTDAQGNPVDLLAELAAGTFAPRFTIAQLGADGTYSSLYYVNKAAAPYVDASGTTVTPTGSKTQASYVTLAAADFAAGANAGEYTATFKTPTGATYVNATQAATLTVAVFGSRSFEGRGYPAADTFNFVPAGGTPAVRQVVTDENCNACHKHLTAHGTRRTVGLCLTCHSPQTSDPESGNTVDMRVMIHKIHSGQPGYFIVGYQQSLVDFSKVVFPDLAEGVKNCDKCHGGAAQAPTPSIAACKSCHTTLADTHGGGSACLGCHDGSIAPSVATAHSARYDAGGTKLTLAGRKLDVTIDSIDANVTAPTVTFTVKVDGVASNLTRSTFCMLPAEASIGPTLSCGSLRFTLGGPTSDYGSGVLNGAGSGFGYLQSTSFTGSDANFALLTPTGTPGQYTAPLVSGTSLTKFAAAAGTSIGVGTELYALEVKSTTSGGCGTGVLASAPSESATCAVREWAQSPTAAKFAKIGGGTATPRRTIASNAKCNACHVDLGFHGGEARKTPEYCAICHHPNNVNDERTTRLEVDGSGNPYKSTPNSVSIMNMAHKIHAGSALSTTFVLGADRGLSKTHYLPADVSTATFAGAFPGDLGDCRTCHTKDAAGKETFGLPKATNLPLLQLTYTCQEDPAADADNFCDTLSLWPAIGTAGAFTVASAADVQHIAPQTAACTSCHDSDAAKGHAALNTTAGGVETCTVCHGAGATYDALEIHQPAP
jgi:OmcA/MtrC family decaheme c-type cytochrome